MKVLLVYPRLSHQVHGIWAPLGLITLATILKQQGEHDLMIDDSSFDRDTSRIEARVISEQPDVVGITVLTDFIPAVRNILKAAKKIGATTVLGGPHPTILPEETFAHLPDTDYIIIGEGEYSFPALLNGLKNGGVSDIPGLVFRENGIVTFGPPREIIPDLDKIPIPDRELLPTHKRYLSVGALNIHAARGCPFKCSFCQPTLKSLFGEKVRARSPDAVADEVAYTVNRYNVDEIFFADDNFTLSKPWLRQVASLLGKLREKKGVKYIINSRVDIFNEEVAGLVKKMGASIVLFGIESGSQEVLDYLDKGTTLEQARKAFAVCRRFGLNTHAYMLLGSPAETSQTLKATEDLIAELAPDSVHISIYAPLPGTKLRDRMEAERKLAWTDFEDLDFLTLRTHKNELPIINPNITYEQVLETRERILASRKTGLFIRNARSLVAGLVKPGGFSKAFTRYRLYRRMHHYFG
jgi:anaerobic magnesium-protoporphyrin IX monomethyl ester cyclase